VRLNKNNKCFLKGQQSEDHKFSNDVNSRLFGGIGSFGRVQEEGAAGCDTQNDVNGGYAEAGSFDGERGTKSGG
jgi:hypothetical protein